MKMLNIIMSSLERLYLVSNKISKIENLECCPKLNMLELGDNKIRKVENLENLKHLKELYLGTSKEILDI